MDGWTGQVLRVDLCSNTSYIEEMDRLVLEQFWGGRGLGAYLLYSQLPAHVDALGPENILAFCAGPLTGVPVPTGGRSSVSTHSPLTNTIFDSNSGSKFGVRLRWAGYDGLVISGVSKKPVWLEISEDGAIIHAADDLWGLEVAETIRHLTDKDSAAVCIGPAGEHLVSFASLMDEEGHAFGRGGVGAVMGSKKLKAIVARGAHRPAIAESQVFKFVEYEARKLLQASPRTSQGLPEFGTAVLVNLMNRYGVLPTRNFREGEFEQAESISGERLREEYTKGRNACWGCPIGCKRETSTADQSGAGPEYETIYALGSNLGIGDLEAVIAANYQCNRLGLDTISLGATLSCAMELGECGLLETNLRFGRADLLRETIDDIAYRRGLGDALAYGSRRLAKRCGAPDLAMQVKGLELPAYDPRGMQGQGLLYATSNRGACHLRGNMLGPELLGLPKMLDRHAASGKAGLLIVLQHTGAAIDSLGMCKFSNFAIGDEFYARMVSTVTGAHFEVQDLQITGERIWNLERLYNLRAGLTHSDDTLPPRFLKEPLGRGGSKGQVVQLERMLEEYNRFRGWTREGVPTQRKIQALGLTELVERFQKQGAYA